LAALLIFALAAADRTRFFTVTTSRLAPTGAGDITGAQFDATEFGSRKKRCKMGGTKGIQQAAISSRELLNGNHDTGRRIIKFARTKPLETLH
jgi:hypothetical protein